MNYLNEIRAFTDYLMYNEKLSTGQINLWYGLMAINNKAHWSEWFTAANLTLESLTGLSRQGIAKARNSLQQLNLIEFRPNGTKATSYHMVSLSTMSNSGIASLQDSSQNSSQVVGKPVADWLPNSGTLIKHKQNKTETKQEINKEAGAPVSPFADEDLLLEFLDFWEAYPRQVKKQAAMDSYVEARNSGVSKATMVNAARNYAKFAKLNGTQSGYITMPDKWLDDQRWTDKLDLTAPESVLAAPQGKEWTAE